MTPERKVGTVVAVALAVLMGAVFLIGKVRVGVSGYNLNVQFKFLNDLKVDAPVKYAGGVIIGRVARITIDKELVNAVLWIERRYRIREDSQFWIFTTGMLGEMYVEVDASPSGTAPFVKEGSTVRGIDPTSTDATLIRLGKIVDALTPLFGKEEVAASLHATVSEMRKVAGKIAAVVEKHTGRIDNALMELETFSHNLMNMSKDIEGLTSQLRSLSDPKSGESIHVTLRRLNSTLVSLEDTSRSAQAIAKKIDAGKGALGVLVNDEGLARDIRAMVKKLKDEPINVKLKLL